MFRLPAVTCSVAALALFVWWMRDRGLVGIVATAAMAICAFQIAHGREACMYAPMELIGVAVAVVSDSWLRKPCRAHSLTIGAVVFTGLLTHVSMFLCAVGLLALAGRRRDADAWRWRGAIAAGVSGWALMWGSSFLVQAHGGHSSWIPHTTPVRFADAVTALLTGVPRMSALVMVGIAAGTIVCRSRDRTLGYVMWCCFVLPVTLAALLGLRAPVLIDRTLTVVAWGPILAVGLPRGRTQTAGGCVGWRGNRRRRGPRYSRLYRTASSGSGQPPHSRSSSESAPGRRHSDPTVDESGRARMGVRSSR